MKSKQSKIKDYLILLEFIHEKIFDKNKGMIKKNNLLLQDVLSNALAITSTIEYFH